MALRPSHPYRSFWFENQCFTVVNPSPVDFLPGIRVGDPDQSYTSKDLRKAVWAINKGPEMAYMLRSSHTDSSLLARLSCDPRNPPIVTTENKHFALRQDVLGTWKDLEQNLYAVSEMLLSHISKIPEAKFAFDAFWPLPRDCGYQKDHTTFPSARYAVLRSRDAFFLLASKCSLAIALFQYRFPAEDPPAWISVLMDQGVPAPWIDELRASPMADLSSGIRVGAFIDPLPGPASTVWMNHVPCMIAANLPIYIPWPTLEGKLHTSLCAQIVHDYPCLAQYLPILEEALVVPSFADPKAFRPFFRWTDIVDEPCLVPIASLSPAALDEELSRLPHGPDQRPGETYEQFFNRREAEGRRRMETETPKSRASRLERTAKAALYPCPTRPTTTFLWIEVGQTNHSSVPWYLLESDYRKAIGFKAAADMWEMYPNSHKRYDPWHDEWDICSRLTDEPVLDGDPGDPDDDNYGFPIPVSSQGTSQNALLLPSLATISNSFHADLQRFYGGEEFAGHLFVAEGFEQVAFYRYGVIFSAPPTSRPPPEYSAFNHSKIQKYFGVLSTDLAGRCVPALSAFLSVALDLSRSSTISSAVFDLDSGCSQHLMREGWPHPTLRLKAWTLSGVEYYRIRYTAEPDCWFDVIVDSTTAIELLRRQDIHSRPSAIGLMAQKGVPFHTLYSPDHRDTFSPQPSPFGDALGWRRRGFTATRHDYGQYIAQAYEVLRQPRGRAAVLHGGIVWRLALEILGSDAVGRAVTGPSEDIFHFGQDFQPRQGDLLYDDSLSPSEINIICGVYKLPGSGSSVELLSWWPRPNVFDTSGLAFGYWTPWCENWFQRRLERIKAGTAGPLSAKEWRTTLMFWKGVFPLRIAMSEKTAAYLSGIC
uniref:Lipoyl synthase (LS) (Lipoate synthase) (Lipoic acid synthase) (Sulfur insertion protein LipA)) n=1 Tax=Ganoderma boninense TaxID=34458 RepID=A0A5K1K4Y4_9APHY|nr:Lipoyl synthase (EC (Lip-syn) (LS) (Lipoate synthase) (Lipoic acid synthase) (Sulfur insertion protein LipA) [Ganoderma boninense]